MARPCGQRGDGVERAEDALLGRGGVRLVSYVFTGDAEDPWSPSVPMRNRECSGEGEGEDEREGVDGGAVRALPG